jgi:hypothetical protein
MPARKKIVALMALWSEVSPLESIPLPAGLSGPALRDARADRPKQHKYARLRFLAQQIGRIVDSANDLSDDELETCIHALQQLQRTAATRPRSNLRRFPNRTGITKEQIWKIRQLESFLGWALVPARLAGFLEHVYHVRQPGDLTHARAWQCIESLFNTAARSGLKADKGAAYHVPKDELAARVAILKVHLSSWQPAKTAAATGPAA